MGAGTGATTATFKGGLGSASAVSSAGHRIAALVAVNALGSATIGDGPHFWAAPFERDGEFGSLGWPQAMSSAETRMRLKGINVTGFTGPLLSTFNVTGKGLEGAVPLPEAKLPDPILPPPQPYVLK